MVVDSTAIARCGCKALTRKCGFAWTFGPQVVNPIVPSVPQQDANTTFQGAPIVQGSQTCRANAGHTAYIPLPSPLCKQTWTFRLNHDGDCSGFRFTPPHVVHPLHLLGHIVGAAPSREQRALQRRLISAWRLQDEGAQKDCKDDAPQQQEGMQEPKRSAQALLAALKRHLRRVQARIRCQFQCICLHTFAIPRSPELWLEARSCSVP